MKPGDVVKRKDGKGAKMCVESVKGLLVWCTWFDGQEKLRKLAFWEYDLEQAGV